MRKFCFLHCVLFSVRSLHPLQLLLLSEAFCNSLKKTWFHLMRACVCANFVRMCGYHPMLFLQRVFFWDSLPEAAMMRSQQDMPRLLAVAQDEEQRGKEGRNQTDSWASSHDFVYSEEKVNLKWDSYLIADGLDSVFECLLLSVTQKLINNKSVRPRTTNLTFLFF